MVPGHTNTKTTQAPGGQRLVDLLASADFHVHSCYSPCAERELTVKRIYELGDALKLRSICLTDHWMSGARRPSWHTNPAIFLDLRDEVNRYAAQHKVRVFVSAEIEVVDPSGTLSADLDLAQSRLDWLSVSTHHLHAPFCTGAVTRDFADDVFLMTSDLLRRPAVTLLLHVEELMNLATAYRGRIPTDLFAELAETARTYGKVFQVGGALSLCRCDEILADYYPGLTFEQFMENMVRFLTELVRARCKIVLGSDSHALYWPYTREQRLWFGNLHETAGLLSQLGISAEQIWTPP